ncbi:phage antirepressor protein [Pseudomonas gregormendelii]|uniref:Phage antirepressor protein n=2 Tax=Pseudomonas gregormendelii TaxID=1628277 RepID=A0ABS3AF53_9PSED|nr:BRO family protein [Pseudomonas gregormendelii]MBN3965587.1 phage antirepressor protein [Pseudomonas gregormendelii]
MQTAQVIPFSFEAAPIRTVLINDQAWFCVTDVCRVLGYANSRDAMSKHCREKGVAKRDTLAVSDVAERDTTSKARRSQTMTFIDEGNLYRLIIKSRKEEALRFEAWVCDEVLPSIRKHGHYEDSNNSMATLIGQTIGTDGFHMLGAVVKGKVSSLPAAMQRRATSKIWSQTHAAFGVRSAADIPADQLDSARNFIAAYALEGEWLPKRDNDIPESLSVTERYMLYADHNGKRQIKAIPYDAFVLSHKDLIKGMVTPGEIMVSTEDMFEFAMAALVNLKSRSEYQTKRVRDLTAACKQNGVKV